MAAGGGVARLRARHHVTAPVVLAHFGHWYWQLLAFAPLLLLAAGLIVANVRDTRDPGRYEREAEEEGERRLDEILKS